MGALDYGKGLYGIGDDGKKKKKGHGHEWSTSEHMNHHLG
jgi:hypothetical protein